MPNIWLRARKVNPRKKGVALPAADGVTKPRAFTVIGVLAAISMGDTLGIELLVTNDDAVIENFYLVEIVRRRQAGGQYSSVQS